MKMLSVPIKIEPLIRVSTLSVCCVYSNMLGHSACVNGPLCCLIGLIIVKFICFVGLSSSFASFISSIKDLVSLGKLVCNILMSPVLAHSCHSVLN